LSTLTVLYTDLYLGRTYRLLQDHIQPDTTFFLGDLFDGGREWATARSSSPEKRYKKYGTNFWLKEYKRFSNIFFMPWREGPATAITEPRGQRIVASLPGNHDLGFAGGIHPAVKSRFDAYFGPLNRVDVLGNHSFVSIDAVSLSAMDQVDPSTGSSGAGDGSAAATASSQIWTPVDDFLKDVKNIRSRAVQREYAHLTGENLRARALFSPDIRDLSDLSTPQTNLPSRDTPSAVPSANFPTILLTHVPLFRAANTPCGPLREGNPSLLLAAGYQYQNVLTPLISSDIITHLTAEEVIQIYSGDDHDYCEIEHNEFTGRTREITVKSMSWAMGVRHPGVQLVSLWNPIDVSPDAKLDTSTPRDTLQNHLCLLPDQLAIFIRYAILLGVSLLILLVRAVLYRQPLPQPSQYDKSNPLLPLTHRPSSPIPKPASTSQTSSVSSTIASSQLLTRNTSKLTGYGYGNLPITSRSSSPAGREPLSSNAADTDDYGMPPRSRSFSSRSPPTGAQTRLGEFGRSLWQVVWPVLLFYFWLLWNG